MRYVRQAAAALVGCLFLVSSEAHGQNTQGLSITNYQFVSEQRWSRTESYVTYRADLVNTGPARDAITATVTSLVPSIQTVPGQRNLHFSPVPAGSTVTSSNTFTLLVDRTVPFSFSSLQWSFLAPFANAGPDQTLAIGTQAILNGSASTNPSGVGSLSYRWAFVSRPAGTVAKLESADSVVSSFIVDVPGSYLLSLTVSNGVESDTDFVTVSTINSPPVANAGPNQSVGLGSTVVLNGAGSSDVDGDPLTYAWTFLSRPSGSAAVLTGATTVAPSFVADKAGTYIVQLIVNDGKAASAPATVQVTTGNTPPVANAGPNQIVNVGSTVQLNGSASTDVDGNVLTYHWSFNSLPGGSVAVLNNAAIVNPTFTVDAPGTYVVQLVVNDGQADSVPATVTITTNALQPPVANAGLNQTVQHGATVALNGSATDPQGLPLTLKWSLETKPAGSTAALSSTTVARPTFVADLPGTYVAQLIANNGFLNSAPSTVTITTTNVAPVANAGPDQSVVVGATVALDGSNSSDADHDPLSFAWSLLTRPNGSTAVLSAATSPTPTFVADVAGTYVVQLIVNDGFANSDPKTVTITAGLKTITLTPNPLNLAANSSGTLTITLGDVAGPGGVEVKLASSDPNIVSLASSVTVPENSTTVGVQVTSHAAGSAFILATATNFTPGSANVNVSSVGITITLESNTIGVTGAVNGTLTLSNPAPPGGVVVTLSASPAGIVSVPATVLIASGTTGSFTVGGLAIGAATITANAPGYTSATANVTVSKLGAIKLPSNVTVGPNQSVAYPVSLLTPAPVGGATVTLTSSDPSIAQVTQQTVFIPQGQTTPAAQPQVNGLKFGSVTMTASAPGFDGDSQTVTVTATLSFSPPTLTVGVGGSANLTLTLSAPAPAGLTIALSSSNTSAATVAPSIAFPSNATSVSVPVTGVAVGSAVIHASSAPHLADTTASVTVALLGSISLPGNLSVGLNQSIPVPITLSAPAPAGGTTVTLTSSDPSKLAISPSTVTIPTGSMSPAVPPQITGLGAGTVNITATAPAYTSDTKAVTVVAALGFSPPSITVTVGSSQNVMVSLPAPAPSALTVDLASDNASVATVPASLMIPANATGAIFQVNGVGVGITKIRASVSGQNQAEATVTVESPGAVGIPSNVSVLLGQKVLFPVTLPKPAASAVTITLSSSDSSKVSISPTILTIAAGQSAPAAQPEVTGVSIGGADITATATGGYTSSTRPVQVSATLSFSPQNVTIVGTATQNVTLILSALTPVPLSVTLTTDKPSVVTVPSTVTIGANQSSASVQLTGVAAGSAVIHASALPNIPDTTANVTVEAPGTLNLPSNLSVPLGQSADLAVTLGKAATAPVTINLTSSDPSKVSVSPATVTIAAGQIAPPSPPKVNGVSIGSASITAAATGFTSATATVNTTATLAFAPPNVTILGFVTQNVVLNLSAVTPVPVVVNLSSSNTAVATVPASVTIPANSSSTTVAVTGKAVGDAVIHATGPAGVPEATANVSVQLPAPLVVPATTSVPLGQSVQFAVSLATPAVSPVNITLSVGDASIVSVSPSSVTIAAGQTTPATQPQVTGLSVGNTNVTASATGFMPGTGAVGVTAALALSPSNVNIGTGTSQIVSVNLPAITLNPLTVTLTSDDPSIAKVPASVIIPANAQKVNFTVDGLAAGTTTIHAAGPANVTGASASVTVQSDILLTPITVGPGQQEVLPLSLAKPAGPDVVYVQLTSSDTTKLTLQQSTVVIQPGNTAPAFPPRVNGINFGTVTVTATALNLAPASVLVKVGANLSFSSNTYNVLPGAKEIVSLSLSSSAPAGGLQVTLSSSDPTIATVPASVIIPAGQTGVAFQVTGVATGQVTITAGTTVPTVPSATTTVTVGTPGSISIPSGVTANIGATVPFPVTLTSPAGPNGVTVTLNASNANVSFVPLVCSGTPCPPIPPGATQTTVTIPSGQTAPASQPQIRAVSPGPVDIAASAPGFAITTKTVQVTASFTFSPQNLTMNANGTGSLQLALSGPAPPPPTGLTVTLTSSNPAVATVPSSAVYFWDGSSPTTLNIAVTGLVPGTTVIRASSPNMADATANVTVTGPLSISTTTLPTGVVGAPYSSVVNAGGGVSPYTWSASGLPAGLTMNPSTGEISGTPSAPGASSVAITVTDSATPTHHTATATLTITVVDSLSITTSSLPSGAVNTSYDVTLSGAGGVTPYSWSASGLPAGLNINAASGLISGTPTTPGTSTVAVTLTDSTNPTHLTTTKSFSLIIVGPLSITTTSLASGVVGTAYSATVSATGGSTPYTWSATGLPAGLNINASTGEISGTPTAAGNSTAIVTVTDSTNPTHLSVSKSFAIVVITPPSITTASLPDGTVGTAYNAPLGATGGTTPYTWAATGLPAGLTINTSTGTISGTPTAAGASTVSITLTDSTNPTHLTATKDLTLNIVGPLTITTTSLAGGVVGAAYNATVAATGGTTPYTWSASSLPAGLSINASTGLISGTPTAAGTSTVTITVTDSTNPTHLSVSKNLSLVILPSLSITTTSLTTGVVGTAYNATVAATGGTTPYSWSATGLPAGLNINTTTGAISGTPTTAGTSTVAVTVTDSTSPTHLTATKNLTIVVLNPLTITTASPLPGGTVNAAYNATVNATGGTAPYTWSASGLPPGLTMNPSTGAISGTATAATTNTVVVTVTDSTAPSPLSTTKNLSLTISGQLTITTSSLPSGVVGTAYSATVAAAGGTTPYTWAATGLPSGLSINTSTGAISGTPTAAGTSTVALTVTDSTNPTHLTASANLSLVIVTPVSITTTVLSTGVVGTAYNATVAAAGGTTPYAWSASGLPAGLTINASSGVISGTPTAAGTSTVAVTVTDATNPTHLTATKNLTLVVVAPLSITTSSLVGGVVGSAYGGTVAATGGTTPYTWSAAGLPAGLTMNPSTGAITGTPTAAGTSTVAVTVTDSTAPAALSATKNLSLVIVAPLSITTTTLSSGAVGSAYSATVAATGGTTPYTWSASGLPAGLTINTSTGVISGTPTAAGTSTVAVTVSDSTSPTNLSATKNFSLVIVAPLSITTTTLPGGVAGTAYNTTVAATGGTTPYTWSATGLPAGLNIDPSTGVIGGTPSAAGTSTVAVTVTDSTNPTHLTATKNLSLVIVAPVSITTTSLPVGTVGSSYNATVAATGGTSPYTWSATGLPAGLNINTSTGAISGTPTAPGTSTVAVTVTDSTNPAHLTATKNLTLVIVAPVSITTASLPAGVVGAAYNTTLAATGGTTPYTWSATGLPAGLTLNASTGVISGTPTATGTSTVAVTVTDSTNPTHLTATANFSLVVVTPLSITTSSLAAGIVGTAYNAPVAATGGTTPYTWSATGLPAGLNINTSTGAITGTPTAAGTSTVAVTVTDSTAPTPLTATKNLTLVVVAPLSITTASPLPAGSLNAPYSTTVVATGGTTPYSWSATGLPAGLTINATSGVISGTPTAQVTATVAVTVTDSTSPAHLSVTKNLSLTIGPAIPAALIPIAGAGQSTQINTQFPVQLQAKVTDASNTPISGVLVTFTAPTSGASLTFSTGGTTVNVVTNAVGIATAPLMTANGVAGSYSVIASVAGLPTVGFTLSNTAIVLPTIGVSNATLGKDLQIPITITLPAPAGSGGVSLVVASSDSSRVLVGGNAKPSIQVTIPEGQTQIAVLVQALVSTGTTSVTASAAGYNDGVGTITLAPSGFVLAGPNDVGASFQTYELLTTTMTVYPARLDASGKYVEKQALRAGLTTTVNVTVSSTAAGFVSPTTLQFVAADSSGITSFKALAAGSATITVETPTGFTPITDGTNTVVATILPSGLVLPSSITVGRNLQTTASVTLNGIVGPSGATLTITSDDASRLKFSTTATGAGSGSITINLPPNAHGSPDFYVQGFANSGSVGYTAQATGFGTATGSVTLAPSGIVFTNAFGGVPNPILAAVGGSSQTVTVYSAMLNASGAWVATQPIAGGLSATVDVTNSGNAAVGTVTPTQVTIGAGAVSGTTQFQPGVAGTTTLAVSVPASPAGFSTPASAYSSLPVQVTTSKIVLTADQIAIGKDLQVQGALFLSQAAPAGGTVVTLTSNSGSLLLAPGATDAGQNSIQITIPAGNTVANFYLQAIGSSGTATYTASAAGYLDGNATVFPTPSGVVLSSTFDIPFVSTTVGGTVAVKVNMAQLDPSTNAYSQTQQLRGGLSLNVTVSTANAGIATVDSPVTINGGADPAGITTLVHGVGAGTTPVTVTQPFGYTAATNTVFAFKPMPSINVTVN
jgi:hypothetical protein